MLNQMDAYTNEYGNLILPKEVAEAYGIKPNSRVIIEKNVNDFKVLRPITQLKKLYIEVTNQCNLDCKTCVRHSWNEPMGNITEPIFTRILEGLSLFSPMPSVFFGGFGEPLLHPQIIDMITRLKSLGIFVELITNGMLLTQEMSQKLMQAGLDVLWVSIDGAKPESYTDVRLGAALPEVLHNIEKLNAFRSTYNRKTPLKLGIAFVAMKRNIGDLPEVARIARSLYANYLKVTNVLPYTQEMLEDVLYLNTLTTSYMKQPELESPQKILNYESFTTFESETTDGEFKSPHDLAVNLPRVDMNSITQGPYSSMMMPGINLTLGGTNFQDFNNRCPFIVDGAGAINWEGSFSPCLPLMHSYHMYLGSHYRYLERWILGNLNEKSLYDLWNLPDHLSFRERVQNFDFSPCVLCVGCELRDNNQKDCYGNEFPTCGGCLWAQGFIQCP